MTAFRISFCKVIGASNTVLVLVLSKDSYIDPELKNFQLSMRTPCMLFFIKSFKSCYWIFGSFGVFGSVVTTFALGRYILCQLIQPILLLLNFQQNCKK